MSRSLEGIHRGSGVMLMALIVAASLVAPTTRASADDVTTDAVGEVVDKAYPWAAAFVRPKDGTPVETRQYCSGVLLKASWVATARHCVRDLETGQWIMGANDVVVIGRRDLRDAGEGEVHHFALADIIEHPTADLALVELASPSALDDMDLAGPSHRFEWGPGTAARLYGYGFTELEGTEQRSPFLRRADMEIDVLYQDHVNMATQSVGGDQGCAGDSGGPLITSTSDGPRLIGIYRGRINPDGQCGSDQATFVFSKVGARSTQTNSPLYYWIVETI